MSSQSLYESIASHCFVLLILQYACLMEVLSTDSNAVSLSNRCMLMHELNMGELSLACCCNNLG